MTRRTRIIGCFLYWVRERLINRRWRLDKHLQRYDCWIDWLDRHPGETYWRIRDRGI